MIQFNQYKNKKPDTFNKGMIEVKQIKQSVLQSYLSGIPAI